MPRGDTVLTILTIEGIGIVSQTKKGAKKSKHGTATESEQVISSRLNRLKEEILLFFITFSHHFSTGPCGHARSVPDIARSLGFLNQGHFIYENFFGARLPGSAVSALGKKGWWQMDG
ncbi:MAG: hypothetical protein OEM26_05410 [Saprospiraceae bacterium]|nr:hypothetical protein [Saprospiraceae bacterium]